MTLRASFWKSFPGVVFPEGTAVGVDKEEFQLSFPSSLLFLYYGFSFLLFGNGYV